MLIVSSLERAREACAEYNPAHIISILSDDEPRPTFAGIAPEDHLKLYMDCETGPTTHIETARARTEIIISSFQNWKISDDILIHCSKGVSRSMAVAFILQCMIQPDQSEQMIARDLRRIAPHADPCLFMVDHADSLLKREGRMFDAVDDLPPCRTTIDAPVVLLQAAA